MWSRGRLTHLPPFTICRIDNANLCYYIDIVNPRSGRGTLVPQSGRVPDIAADLLFSDVKSQ